MKLLLLVALFSAAELANGVPPVNFEFKAGNEECGACLSMFDKAGGCECIRNNCNNVTSFIPEGCFKCGGEAGEYCNTPDNSADDSPCCFTYGFGARAIPCCFNILSCEEHDKLVEEQEENGPLLGGAMGKHHFCPRDAAHAHQLLSERGAKCSSPGETVPSPHDSCNTCVCSASGYLEGCTLIGCPDEPEIKLCDKPGETVPSPYDSCNSCRCSETGEIEECTLIGCIDKLEPLEDDCLDCGIRMCPSGKRAICCPETKSCECPEECGAQGPGTPCGNILCGFGEECCQTCNDQGQLIPSSTCAPLCPQPLCIAPPKGPPKECGEFCTLDYTPVCGTDGQTYSNKCSLEGKACEDKSNLAIAYQGECNSGGKERTKCGNPGKPVPSPFDSCNTCRCGDTGLVEGCTRKLCSVFDEIDDRNTTCNNPGGSVPSPYDSCGNTCRCTESGFIGACTEIGCIEESPCCFQYGFGQFQIPCCFNKISCEEHDRLLEEQKEHGPPPGGAMGKHSFCPVDAAHAHELLTGEKQPNKPLRPAPTTPYDKLLHCKDNDPNYCEENTDGEFNFCHPLPQPSCFVDGLTVKNCYGVCVPEDESCDENKPCQSIGSAEVGGLLSSKCENGKCVFAGAIVIA